MSKDEYRDNHRDDENDERPRGSSRLGKEAKIGVTVIALLLIVLGVVLAVRLSGVGSDDGPAVAANQEDDKERAGHQRKTDAMHVENRPPLFGGGAAPTVVPAKVASSTPPKSPRGAPDPWKLASGHGDGRRAGGPPQGPPPSFIPEPPKPPTERHDRYAMNSPGGREADRAIPVHNPARDNQTPSHLRHRGVDREDSSGYAAVEAAPAPPRHRENSRYEDVSSAWSPGGSSYSSSSGDERSVPAMPVLQHGGDYRHEHDGARQSGGEPRRFGGASSYRNPPPRRDDGKYEVQPNDSYWTISERLFGTGAYFNALARHNRSAGAEEDRLQPGTLIATPTAAELEKSYPDLCPRPTRRDALQSQAQSRASTVSGRSRRHGGRTYTVAEGDTLFGIARYELGKASRWAEIYDLNRDVLGKDFNYLTPGTQLVLPDAEKSDVIARPSGTLYRR